MDPLTEVLDAIERRFGDSEIIVNGEERDVAEFIPALRALLVPPSSADARAKLEQALRRAKTHLQWSACGEVISSTEAGLAGALTDVYNAAVALLAHEGETPQPAAEVKHCDCNWGDVAPEKPCGCGQHNVRLYRDEVWHWAGQHWTSGCLIHALAKGGIHGSTETSR